MGGELVRDSSPDIGDGTLKSSVPKTLTEQFYEVFPFYLSIGMTYSQFWHEDCCLVKYYRKAHEIVQQRKNQELWVQGAYIYEVLADISPILVAFPRKGAKALPYLNEPIPLTRRDVLQKKEREARIRYEKQKSKVTSWIKGINKKS